MKIVIQNSNGAVVMVADCSTDGYNPSQYTIHNIKGWDWSLVNLTDVDTSKPNWVYCQLEWNGSTLVKRSTLLPQPWPIA